MNKNLIYLILVNFDKGGFDNTALKSSLKYLMSFKLQDFSFNDLDQFYKCSCYDEILKYSFQKKNIYPTARQKFNNPDYISSIDDDYDLSANDYNVLNEILTHPELQDMETSVQLYGLYESDIYIINTKNLYHNDQKIKIKLPDILYNLLKTKIGEDYNLRLLIHDKEHGKDPDIYDTYNNLIEVLTFMHEKYPGGVFEKISEEFNNPKAFEAKLEHLFDKLGKKKLKHNLINLFLPFSIDIQGLHDLKEKEKNDISKLEAYYNEVRNSLNQEKDSMLEKWKELKDKISAEDKKLPINIINAFANNDYKNFDKEFIDSNNKDKFLPDWLERVTEEL